MDDSTEDGKIRVRCTGCGKRVKFPAGAAGAAFRCKVCHTMVIAPLDGGDIVPPTRAELKTVIPTPPPPESAPMARKMAQRISMQMEAEGLEAAESPLAAAQAPRPPAFSA